jgi:hypothetical protein
MLQQLVLAEVFRWCTLRTTTTKRWNCECVFWEFVMAVGQGNDRICRELIRLCRNAWDDESEELLCVEMGSWVLDPGGWPVSFVRMIPVDYLWPLAKAVGGCTEPAPPSSKARSRIAD